ncbi:MAG: SMC family ATPase [Clostridiales bacterium]|nr:SMC family ATPase [Clostridiales bacterium]
MRPIELKIKGINSFVEEQTVDFDRLTKDGLFGIVGDTVSGKSSVLDAMTIALYGELSKNTNEFINKESNSASVVFDFAVEENGAETVYRAERTFKRTSTKECVPSLARLSKQSGEVIADKIRDVNKAAEALIGLSYDDFTRTVVLPQGKFSEFLNLKGAERRSMLERIFALEKYGSALAQRLKGERLETGGELNAVTSKMEVYGDISRELCSIKEKELTVAKEEALKAAAVLEKTKKRAAEAEKIADLEGKLKKQTEDIAEIEKERKSVDDFAQRMNIEATIEGLTETAGTYKQAIKLLAEIEEAEGKISLLKKTTNGLKQKYVSLKADKKRLEEEEIKNAEAVKEAEKLREKLSAERSKDMVELIKGGDRLKELREKGFSAKEAYTKQRQLFIEINELLAAIKEENEKLEQLNKKHDETEALKLENDKSIENAENSLTAMRDKNMAAVLAKNLKEGEMCPVCGSREHPNIAEDIEDTLKDALEKSIKELKEKGKSLEKSLTKIKADIAASKKLIETKTAEKEKKEADTKGVKLDKLKADLEKLVEEYRAEEKLDAERKKAQEKEKNYLDAEKAEKAVRKKAEELAEKARQTDRDLADCEAEGKIASAELKRMETEREIKAAEVNKAGGDNSPAALLKETENAIEIMNNYSRRKNLAEDNIKRLNDELGGRRLEAGELDRIRTELKNSEDMREAKSNEIAVREKELAQMKDNLVTLADLKKEEKQLRKRHDMLLELSKLTEGNRFVEYMAENSLKYIAADASVRLKNISGGRYALELLDGEFIIRDDFCGGIRRRPATLSGGETFLTSFALALSLSDRIQMKNSASLKFFFLDEGFGTLDKNTLDVVMKSLETLCQSGMKVGLITHVEEVKDRLPVRLYVTGAVPGEHGTRVRIG